MPKPTEVVRVVKCGNKVIQLVFDTARASSGSTKAMGRLAYEGTSGVIKTGIRIGAGSFSLLQRLSKNPIGATFVLASSVTGVITWCQFASGLKVIVNKFDALVSMNKMIKNPEQVNEKEFKQVLEKVDKLQKNAVTPQEKKTSKEQIDSLIANLIK